jgi:hypothetical protein
MKKYLLLAILLIAFATKGQTTLTYGQVNNFDVGDVVQGTYNSSFNFNPNPPIYRTTTILSKTITINNDSIIYNSKTDSYTPPSCPTCSAINSTYTGTWVATNLNITIPNTNATTCLATKDTLYYSNCNKKTYEVHPVYGNNCFEPTTETSKFIEGVGYFYTKFIANAPNYAESFTLNYYKKQSGNCPIDLFINEQKNNLNEIYVFPNPTKNIINLRTNNQILRFDIFDLDGKMVLGGYIVENKIDLEVLKAGTYTLNVLSNEHKVNTTKIIKE